MSAHTLDNSDGLIQVTNNTKIDASEVINRAGQIVVTGGELFEVAAEVLDNSLGLIASNAVSNQLTAESLVNNQGRFEFYQDLSLQGAQLVNQQGVIAANNSLLNFNDIDNTLAGQITSANRLDIVSQNMTSDGVISATQVTLNLETCLFLEMVKLPQNTPILILIL